MADESLLSQMQNVDEEELLGMPKIPVVLTAWLGRPGIPEMKRLEALAALGEKNGTTSAAELLKVIETAATEDESVASDLGRLRHWSHTVARLFGEPPDVS